MAYIKKSFYSQNFPKDFENKLARLFHSVSKFDCFHYFFEASKHLYQFLFCLFPLMIRKNRFSNVSFHGFISWFPFIFYFLKPRLFLFRSLSWVCGRSMGFILVKQKTPVEAIQALFPLRIMKIYIHISVSSLVSSLISSLKPF